jgi:hypothetical protein
MFYVCEAAHQPFRFVAGPFQSEKEANVAAGAFEADNPALCARTFIWDGTQTDDSADFAEPVQSHSPRKTAR